MPEQRSLQCDRPSVRYAAYVAARADEIPYAQRIQKIVHETGGRITMDWTRQPQGPDDALPRDYAQRLAAAEREGVLQADVVVLCWDAHMTGALLEVGMALAHFVRVIVLGCQKHSIFWDLPEVTLVADEAGLRSVLVGFAAVVGASA